MDLSVVFAGTAGSVPTARRGLPATLIRRGGDRILVDCGEGTQRQLIRSVGLADIDDVFITHLHVDHWLGLPGMIKSFELRDRDRPLTIYGPRGIKAAMDGLRFVLGKVRFPMRVVELEEWEDVERDGYSISAVPVRHRITAYGYVLSSPSGPAGSTPSSPPPRASRPARTSAACSAARPSTASRPSEVIGPDRPGRKIVLSGDTAPCETLRVAAHKADLLIHEATFTEEERDRARETAHSTAHQAATLADDAEVRLLALTHLSTRYGGGEIRDEARATFPNTVVPRDFDIVEIPFPEKGEPTVHRLDGERVPV